ncbi:MAG TPA: hypothetical protein VEI07_13420 [Planctomycetaceae bacterium]|nr:hypothetical protein [Planctomycetaceae bacterium]
MKRFISAVCVLALTAAPALAGDGQVSKQSLSRMGLGGMKVVSEQEGLQVRGTSIAIATSSTTVTGGFTIISINSPISIGSNFAFSAKVTVGSGLIAGGFASASAH